MYQIIKTKAVDGGPFNCRPVTEWEVQEKDIHTGGDIGYAFPHQTGHDKWIPWLIHGEFGPLCVVWAEYEQDALDVAADEGFLDGYRVEADIDDDLGDDAYEEDASSLGNNGDMYNLDYIRCLKVDTSNWSTILWLRLYEAWSNELRLDQV